MTNEEAIKLLETMKDERNSSVMALALAIEALRNERPQGKWIKITKDGTIPVEYICSACGRKIFDNYEHQIPQSEFYPFCHCGADMRGDKE
jgi:DNA-directed RNA polymerase subunit RPC12/RpoP